MNIDDLLPSIVVGKPNSRTNPLGWLRLDLADPVTRRYAEAGFYVDVQGYIYDTLVWPGDKVKNTKPGISIGTDDIYIVKDIQCGGKYSCNEHYDLDEYKIKHWNYASNNRSEPHKVRHSIVIPKGYSKGWTAKNFVLVNGANNMTLAIEANKPTFVREFVDRVVDGDNVREYIGSQTEFKTLSAAKTHVANTISESIRASNTYRKFAVFQEVHVAQAKQPEVEFV